MSTIYLQQKLEGKTGQFVLYGSDGKPELRTINVFNSATVIVTINGTAASTTGLTVIAQKGTKTINGTYDSQTDKWNIVIDEAGMWDIIAKLDNVEQDSETILIETSGETYEVTLLIIGSLEDTDWNIIQQVAQQSLGETYWAVGDRKSITLNGEVVGSGSGSGSTTQFNNTPFYAYIIGFNHNSEIEGVGISFQISSDKDNTSEIDYVIINNVIAVSGVVSEGWGDSTCVLRTILGNTSTTADTLYSCLPSDLRSVLKKIRKSYLVNENSTAITKYCDDYITIPSKYEVTGDYIHGLPGTNESQSQNIYEYYSSSTINDDRIRYVYTYNGLFTTDVASWWLRSRDLGRSNYWWYIQNDGMPNSPTLINSSNYTSPIILVG